MYRPWRPSVEMYDCRGAYLRWHLYVLSHGLTDCLQRGGDPASVTATTRAQETSNLITEQWLPRQWVHAIVSYFTKFLIGDRNLPAQLDPPYFSLSQNEMSPWGFRELVFKLCMSACSTEQNIVADILYRSPRASLKSSSKNGSDSALGTSPLRSVDRKVLNTTLQSLTAN